MSINLIGPITTSNSFMMVNEIGGDAYGLMLISAPSGTTGERYDLVSLSNTGGISGSFGVFSASQSGENVSIQDNANGGWLNFDNENYLINSSVQGNFTVVQDSTPYYQPWLPPVVFLADVSYTLQQSGTTASVFVIDASGSKTTQPLSFQALPVTWYFNCVNGDCDRVNVPSNSLEIWSCLINPNIQGCVTEQPILGWTNIADATNGKAYLYCPVGDFCGNNNCNGPCKEFYDNCTTVSNSNYFCLLDAGKYFTETKWWKTPLFIGVVSAITVVIAVLIIIIFVLMKHKIDAAGNDSQ